MNKVISWIVLVLGVYQVLSLLVDALPAVLENTWGWVVGLVLLIAGLIMVFKKEE